MDATAVKKMEAPVLFAVMTWLKGAGPATVELKLSAGIGVKSGVTARADGTAKASRTMAKRDAQWRANS